MKQLLLPFYKRVIFVDWHGVASNDPFFLSILNNKTHPLYSKLTNELNNLFKNNDNLIRAWMRGEVSYEQIVDLMDITLDNRFKDDFLFRKVIEDCKFMKVNPNLIDLLSILQNYAFIVLATDNMDCFFHYINSIRVSKIRSKKRQTYKVKEYVEFDKAILKFDDILCSSEIGVLKRESPAKFFGNWLKVYSLNFSDALLLDDVDVNCEEFVKAGGNAFKIKKESLYSEYEMFKQKVMNWVTYDK